MRWQRVSQVGLIPTFSTNWLTVAMMMLYCGIYTEEILMPAEACKDFMLNEGLASLSGWPLAFAMVGLAFAFVFFIKTFLG